MGRRGLPVLSTTMRCRGLPGYQQQWDVVVCRDINNNAISWSAGFSPFTFQSKNIITKMFQWLYQTNKHKSVTWFICERRPIHALDNVKNSEQHIYILRYTRVSYWQAGVAMSNNIGQDNIGGVTCWRLSRKGSDLRHLIGTFRSYSEKRDMMVTFTIV